MASGVTTRGWMLAFAGLLSLVLCTCSRSSSGPALSSAEQDAASIRERADRWWACRISGDYRTQYDLWDPDFKRKATLDQFLAGQGSTKYLSYQLKDVAVDGDYATVTVEYVSKIGIKHKNLDPDPTTTTTEQTWVKSDGAWYFKCPDNPLQGSDGMSKKRARKAAQSSAEASGVQSNQEPTTEKNAH